MDPMGPGSTSRLCFEDETELMHVFSHAYVQRDDPSPIGKLVDTVQHLRAQIAADLPMNQQPHAYCGGLPLSPAAAQTMSFSSYFQSRRPSRIPQADEPSANSSWMKALKRLATPATRECRHTSSTNTQDLSTEASLRSLRGRIQNPASHHTSLLGASNPTSLACTNREEHEQQQQWKQQQRQQQQQQKSQHPLQWPEQGIVLQPSSLYRLPAEQQKLEPEQQWQQQQQQQQVNEELQRCSQAPSVTVPDPLRNPNDPHSSACSGTTSMHVHLEGPWPVQLSQHDAAAVAAAAAGPNTTNCSNSSTHSKHACSRRSSETKKPDAAAALTALGANRGRSDCSSPSSRRRSPSPIRARLIKQDSAEVCDGFTTDHKQPEGGVPSGTRCHSLQCDAMGTCDSGQLLECGVEGAFGYKQPAALTVSYEQQDGQERSGQQHPEQLGIDGAGNSGEQQQHFALDEMQQQQQERQQQEMLLEDQPEQQLILCCVNNSAADGDNDHFKHPQDCLSNDDLLMGQLFPDQQALSAAGRRVGNEQGCAAVVVGMVHYARKGERQGWEMLREQMAPATGTVQVILMGSTQTPPCTIQPSM